MTRLKERELIHMPQVLIIQEIGLMINSMGLVLNAGQMVQNMKENMVKGRNMEWVSYNLLMVVTMMVNLIGMK